MPLRIVKPDPKYAPAQFLLAPRWGYVHVAAAVEPPTAAEATDISRSVARTGASRRRQDGAVGYGDAALGGPIA
jgi:hypothetical protein